MPTTLSKGDQRRWHDAERRLFCRWVCCLGGCHIPAKTAPRIQNLEVLVPPASATRFVPASGDAAPQEDAGGSTNAKGFRRYKAKGVIHALQAASGCVSEGSPWV